MSCDTILSTVLWWCPVIPSSVLSFGGVLWYHPQYCPLVVSCDTIFSTVFWWCPVIPFSVLSFGGVLWYHLLVVSCDTILSTVLWWCPVIPSGTILSTILGWCPVIPSSVLSFGGVLWYHPQHCPLVVSCDTILSTVLWWCPVIPSSGGVLWHHPQYCPLVVSCDTIWPHPQYYPLVVSCGIILSTVLWWCPVIPSSVLSFGGVLWYHPQYCPLVVSCDTILSTVLWWCPVTPSSVLSFGGVLWCPSLVLSFGGVLWYHPQYCPLVVSCDAHPWYCPLVVSHDAIIGDASCHPQYHPLMVPISLSSILDLSACCKPPSGGVMAELLACNVSSALEALYHDHHVNTANGFKGHKCFLKKMSSFCWFLRSSVAFSSMVMVSCIVSMMWSFHMVPWCSLMTHLVSLWHKKDTTKVSTFARSTLVCNQPFSTKTDNGKTVSYDNTIFIYHPGFHPPSSTSLGKMIPLGDHFPRPSWILSTTMGKMRYEDIPWWPQPKDLC